MIKELVHDPIFLTLKSVWAFLAGSGKVAPVFPNLLRGQVTDKCLPFLNQEYGALIHLFEIIGGKKQPVLKISAQPLHIICFDNDGKYMIMLNPEIIKRSDPYETEESCLSLLGGPRKIKRYKKIRVQYQTLDFKIRTKTFEGWTAQIVQHEIDHCNGVLI